MEQRSCVVSKQHDAECAALGTSNRLHCAIYGLCHLNCRHFLTETAMLPVDCRWGSECQWSKKLMPTQTKPCTPWYVSQMDYFRQQSVRHKTKLKIECLIVVSKVLQRRDASKGVRTTQQKLLPTQTKPCGTIHATDRRYFGTIIPAPKYFIR